MKTPFFLLLSLFYLSGTLGAHSPDISSTVLVQQHEDVWVLQIRAALTAFDYAIEYHYGESAYASPEEFQDLVLDHVRENVSVGFNNSNFAFLEEGRVVLGHETNVTFRVKGLPENAESLEVINATFSSLPHSQSALMVQKEGFDKKHFVLSNDNDYTAGLKASGSEFILVKARATKAIYPYLLTLSVALFFGVLGYLFLHKNQPALSLAA